MDIAVVKIELSFSVHATEDIEKNMEIISKLIPQNNFDHANIKQEKLEGGYGNPIEFLQITFTRKKEMDNIIANLASNLDVSEKKKLNSEFHERFNKEKSTFFFRFAKESLYKNKFQISSSTNVIKVALKMRSFVKNVDFRKYMIDRGILLEE